MIRRQVRTDSSQPHLDCHSICPNKSRRVFIVITQGSLKYSSIRYILIPIGAVPVEVINKELVKLLVLSLTIMWRTQSLVDVGKGRQRHDTNKVALMKLSCFST